MIAGSDMTVDDRAYLMQLVSALRVEDALPMLYPTVFPISDLILEEHSAEVCFTCTYVDSCIS